MTRLLALLCGVLAVVISAEVLQADGGGSTGQGGGGGANGAGQLARRTAAAPRPLAQWRAIVVARPLFAPDRRPAADTLGADAELPRLTGVVIAADDAVAIFQPPGKVRPVVVRHGGTVGGWTVTAIANDSVSLRKSTDGLVLRPQFGDTHTAVAANQQKPPQSRWQVAAETGMLRARWANPQLQP